MYNPPGEPFNPFRKAVTGGLRRDPILMVFLGTDVDDHRKVFELRAKTDATPPYIMWGVTPDQEPSDGHYGDMKSLEGITFQLNNWGEDRDEAWQVFSMSDEALDRLEINVELEPYKMLQIVRLNVQAVPDDTTSWWQVAATYRAVLSR